MDNQYLLSKNKKMLVTAVGRLLSPDNKLLLPLTQHNLSLVMVSYLMPDSSFSAAYLQRHRLVRVCVYAILNISPKNVSSVCSTLVYGPILTIN